MDFGYSKNEIMKLLDSHLQDVNANMEEQIGKLRKGSNNPEVSLATLLTSSMLSMLEAVSAVIDVNNKKIQKDIQGLVKGKAAAQPKAKAKAPAKGAAKPKAKAAAKSAPKAKAGAAKGGAKTKAKAKSK
jgi:hypothetical protein